MHFRRVIMGSGFLCSCSYPVKAIHRSDEGAVREHLYERITINLSRHVCVATAQVQTPAAVYTLKFMHHTVLMIDSHSAGANLFS